MKFVLDIRVLATMNAQQFVVPVDLTGPATLLIQPSPFGLGHLISVVDDVGGKREWYANELIGLRFEMGEYEITGVHTDTGREDAR